MSTVACVFGGRSVEHEVSVITAHQAMAALGAQHRSVPVYIAKDGRWYTGAALADLRSFSDVAALLRTCTPITPVIDAGATGLTLVPNERARRGLFSRGGAEAVTVDVVMPLLHGPQGEDGTLQGLLEMAGVPYTGSGVAASAVAMDKRLAKTVLRAAGLPVLDDACVERESWEANRDGGIARAESAGPYPLYVKPVTLGSSIGVSRVTDRAELAAGIDVALTYDGRCLIEPALEGIVEINCAVLGDETGARASLLEQPTVRGLLSYDDKYRSGGAKAAGAPAGMKSARRLIPAPVDPALAKRVSDAALSAFAAIGAAGVARVDLMVDVAAATFVVNEINPLPGSLSFYLFEPAGVSFTALLDELIALALARSVRSARSTAVFETWMLGGGGAKQTA